MWNYDPEQPDTIASRMCPRVRRTTMYVRVPDCINWTPQMCGQAMRSYRQSLYDRVARKSGGRLGRMKIIDRYIRSDCWLLELTAVWEE